MNLPLHDGLQAVDLNDEWPGRILDRLDEAGVAAVFTRVAPQASLVGSAGIIPGGPDHSSLTLLDHAIPLEHDEAPGSIKPLIISSIASNCGMPMHLTALQKVSRCMNRNGLPQ